MCQLGAGKAHRKGISIMELCDMFPDEASATKWFEALVWANGRHCPRCSSADTSVASETSGLPYYCSGCQRAFSVRIGTALERSKVPLRKWVFAIYLEMTSLKGVSSIKLHRDIKVTQKTAWFMRHRIRKAWSAEALAMFTGPVEVVETYIGGKRKNMSNGKRRELAGTGRGAFGKAAAAGIRDRKTKQVSARLVQSTDKPTLQGLIRDTVEPGSQLYKDEAGAYAGMPEYGHDAANRSISEYVRDQAHTNGVESFWSMLKHGYRGVYHYMSDKRLHRYVAEFAGHHNVREGDAMQQVATVVADMVGKRPMYRDPVS